MSKFPNLLIIFLLLKLIKSQIYCGIKYINYNVSFPTKKPTKSADNNYKPISIYLEYSSLSDYILNSQQLYNITFSLDYVANILQELIEVKPLNYEIAIEQND